MHYYFVNVILPLPIHRLFTYRISLAEKEFLKVGARVAVPFGKNKIYSGLAYEIHQKAPAIPLKEIKSIHQILDKTPIVNAQQLQLWQWIAAYYLCSLGEIYRAALPSAFLLESEKVITKTDILINPQDLTDEEYLIYEALQQKNECSIGEITKLVPQKKILAILKQMLQKKALTIKEVIYEKYKPLKIKTVALSKDYENKEALNALLEELKKAKKQHHTLLCYFALLAQKKDSQKQIRYKTLQEKAQVTSATLKTMVDKKIFEIHYVAQGRIQINKEKNKQITLSGEQEQAFREIQKKFTEKKYRAFIRGYGQRKNRGLYTTYKRYHKKRKASFVFSTRNCFNDPANR